MSNIKDMIQATIGLAPKSKEKQDHYLERLAVAIKDIPDAKLVAMPPEVVEYLNKNLNLEIGKEPEAAPQANGADTSAAVPPASTEPATPTAPPVKAKRAPRAKAAPKPPKIRPDITGHIKRAVFKSPSSTADEVYEGLTKSGIKVSKSTVQTVRADFFHTVRVLKDLGVVDPGVMVVDKTPEPAKEAAQPAA